MYGYYWSFIITSAWDRVTGWGISRDTFLGAHLFNNSAVMHRLIDGPCRLARLMIDYVAWEIYDNFIMSLALSSSQPYRVRRFHFDRRFWGVICRYRRREQGQQRCTTRGTAMASLGATRTYIRNDKNDKNTCHVYPSVPIQVARACNSLSAWS